MSKYLNRKYIIINASEVSSIDFSKVLEKNTGDLRYNNDKNKTFVKIEGTTPSFLEGKTQYTCEELAVILNDSDNGWITDPE
tara:strand:- start:345 stop:590 length:246 start_codon:yes stop_codon:yes gene_type:complete